MKFSDTTPSCRDRAPRNKRRKGARRGGERGETPRQPRRGGEKEGFAWEGRLPKGAETCGEEQEKSSSRARTLHSPHGGSPLPGWLAGWLAGGRAHRLGEQNRPKKQKLPFCPHLEKQRRAAPRRCKRHDGAGGGGGITSPRAHVNAANEGAAAAAYVVAAAAAQPRGIDSRRRLWGKNPTFWRMGSIKTGLDEEFSALQLIALDNPLKKNDA
ncbi:uncharacterized protein LOC128423679 [Podarcis raffonei]|uniref:uncharacterized protein LOC128423679 n=1 Tax=Podarcis raffonei TaxID=65483 RepID=UPI002329907E|nr:uncharacterized protein LOC128423679 [Podarcis raffonei]